MDRSAYLSWCEYKYAPLFEGLSKDAPILELGCGPGDMLEFLRRSGFSAAEGIDVSPQQVQLATDRGLTARVADVFDCLESAPRRYRMIMALDFMEHFSKEELMRLVPAIRKALVPGGMLILQTPNGQGLLSNYVVYGDLTHLTVFTPKSLKQLLLLWGFGDFRFIETGPSPNGWKGKLRALAWAVISRCADFVQKIESGRTQGIWTENLICCCTRDADEVADPPV